jgi:uncharacterized protein (TIGR02118 family)
MKTVTLSYPRSEGARFDMDYYLKTHMKMVTDGVGDACRSITVETGEGDAAPFATVRFVVDSMEAFGAAMAPYNAKFQGDMANYTDVRPVMHVSALAIDHAPARAA